jgi:ubiquinone/menaquinone biosynthesis C-methylase UbiE
MQLEDAIALIRSSVIGREGDWADLGAGRGTFTRALASILGPENRIYSVDADAGAVAELEGVARELPNVSVTKGDFSQPLDLPALDGILLANALHFVKEHAAVLARLVKLLKPNGRVVLIEYDKRAADRWLPYPIPIASLPALAKAAGLGKFTVTESRPSNYQGIIYAAYAETA